MIDRIKQSLVAGARTLRYFLADLFFLIARPLRGVGSRLSEFWRSLEVATRKRIAVAGGAIALVVVIVVAVTPNLPCGSPGADGCAPEDEAMKLVPADALAYVHANLEEGTDQYEQAVEVANRAPVLSPQVLGQVAPLLLPTGGAPIDFGGDIAPWFGGELALAVVPGAIGTERIQIFEVADEEGAVAFAESLSAGAPEPQDYQGVEILEDQRGLSTAVLDDFLVVGSAEGLRAIVDAARGVEGVESLADDENAEAVMEELPAERVAEAYLSAEGIDSFLALSEGPLAPFEPLVDSGNSLGAAFALSADDGGFRVASRSNLDPERSEEGGGFFSAFTGFQPELPAELAPDTLAFVGVGEAQATIDDLLAQATVRAPGIAQGAADLVERLRDAGGTDITSELLPALGGEAAVAVVPRPAPDQVVDELGDEVPGALQAPDAPETIDPSLDATPYIEFLAGDVDEEGARNAMAGLQSALAETVDPRLGSPVFREETLGEVTAQVLTRSPADILAYGISDSKLVVADDAAPIERLDGDADEGLAASEAYEAGTEGLAEEPALLVYLDLGGLVGVAEALGAGAEGPFASFAEDLRRLQTLALTVENGEDQLSADALLRIASP